MFRLLYKAILRLQLKRPIVFLKKAIRGPALKWLYK